MTRTGPWVEFRHRDHLGGACRDSTNSQRTKIGVYKVSRTRDPTVHTEAGEFSDGIGCLTSLLHFGRDFSFGIRFMAAKLIVRTPVRMLGSGNGA